MKPPLLSRLDPRVPVPSLPDPGQPGVTVWRPQNGPIGSLSHIVDGEYWVHTIDVASFRLDPERGAVRVKPCGGVDEDIVYDVYERSIWPALLQLQGREVLHAGAVANDSGVFAFCAPAQSGKSTLAYGLAASGLLHWADDAVVVEVGQKVQAVPLSFQARLRPPTAAHFGYAGEQLVRGKVIRTREAQMTSRPLRAICLLERTGAFTDQTLVRVRRVPKGECLARVLEHAQFFGLQDGARKRTMVENYLQIVDLVPVLEVTIRHGFTHLYEVIRLLKTDVFQRLEFDEPLVFSRDDA